MSNNRRVMLAEIPVVGNPKINVIEVELSYNAGGINYFTYTEENRGLYLSVQPTLVRHEGMFVSRQFTGFSGVKMFQLPMTRFSKKKLNEFEPDREDLIHMIQRILTTNGLKFENPSELPLGLKELNFI